ncbi:MAG TPA: hypothetical protein VK716_12150, partial [Terracidiphilus sp.]|nr:hypothetical protein [Terracidiphilus sp.]
MAKTAYEDIVAEIREFAETAANLMAVQSFAVGLIANRLEHYDWVGFYMLDPEDKDVLVLGPFHGAATEHVR